MNKVNFLNDRSNIALKKEILNIDNSYSNPWDKLSELTQNSYDSIIRFIKDYGETIKSHKIEIEIDSKNRLIKVRDTGIGIKADKVKNMISPNNTDKENDDYSIGEKGVGLTYTIFSCNLFEIVTQSPTTYLSGRVSNGCSWKNGASDHIPEFEIIEEHSHKENIKETFTQIILKDVENVYDENEDIFNQSTEILEYIIRTKTVIGYLKGVFKEKVFNLDVQLTHITLDGKTKNINLLPQYMLPTDFFKASKVIDLEEFKKSASTLDDRQKTKKLKGKILRKIGSEQRAGRKINYYCVFVPSRNTWTNIGVQNKLSYKNEKNTDVSLFSGGIYIATKGMPTGIVLDTPIAGFSGYWPSFYIILEDDSIVFDLGRKTIPPRTKGLFKDIAKMLFNEFLPYIKYVTSDPEAKGGTNTTIQQYERSKMFEEIETLPDLGIDNIGYLKNPDNQEAGVVAIFHELVGAGILKGYNTIKTGYKQTYDSWTIYKIEEELIGENNRKFAKNGIMELQCVIEFKFKAESILDEFEKDIKFFTDIDLIVCWDVDEIAFSKQRVEVELIEDDDVLFYGSNYKLIWPGAYNLGAASEKYVLSLRKFIEDYKKYINN
ncbi:hypothetical protein FHH43_07625 [Clostridium perfringens]|nr:hypothetical protein [Clostridium perfringens]